MSKLPPDLIKNSQYYDWFAALLLCEAQYLDKKRIGDSAKPSEEYIRLGQKPVLIFPAQAIYGLNTTTNPPWLMQYFFGVFGVNGALPLHLTEYAIEQEKYHKDTIFTHFINIFHHRALSLFYRSWRLAQPTADFLPAQPLSFAKKIESLVGVAEFKEHHIKDKKNNDITSSNVAVAREKNLLEKKISIIYKSYVFYLAKSSRNVVTLILLLSDIMNVPIDIKTNIVEYLDKQNIYYSFLGKNESSLGRGLQLGKRVLSAQSSMNITIGPVSLEKYTQLLLEDTKKMLVDIVKKVIGLNFNINIEFVVERKLPIKLKDKIILGRNNWLGNQNTLSKGIILKL